MARGFLDNAIIRGDLLKTYQSRIALDNVACECVRKKGFTDYDSEFFSYLPSVIIKTMTCLHI